MNHVKKTAGQEANMSRTKPDASPDTALRDPYDLALTEKLQYMEAESPGEIPPLLAELFLPPKISDGRHAFRFLDEKIKSAKSSQITRQQKSLESDQKLQDQMREAICALYRRMETLFDGSTPASKLAEEHNAIRDLNRSVLTLTDTYLDDCIRLERRERQIQEASETSLLSVRGQKECLVTHTKRDSRILLGTDAGGGKTTLLHMIALYYSSAEYKNGMPPYSETSGMSGEGVLTVRRYLYPLEDFGRPLIPCLLRLRDYAGKNSLEYEIRDSILRLLPGLSREELRLRCEKWASDLILLIDGLDELSAEKKQHFLQNLQKYLDANPTTPIILTSRAAGVADSGSAEALASMHFQCRSILPLSDQDVQSYAEKWIHRMRPERETALKHNLALIRSERRYAYLREFTRTPLDLLTFLNLLSEGTVAPGRYRMLRESPWKKFTGHEPNPSRKQHLYTDTIHLLGLIAYRMQVKQKLSITLQELDEMREDLNNLNYYSDIAGAGTLEDYQAFLNLLAANTGVMDTPREGEYEFPIRTCQEFLAAWACCHMKPEPSMTAPDPRSVVESHAADENWFGVICFLLSDLEDSDTRLFRELFTLTFQKRAEAPQANLLLPLIDTDLPVSGKDAAILCEKYFQKGTSSWMVADLLAACMRSDSSGVYLRAMENAYYENPEDSVLPAYGLALILRDHLAGQSSGEFARYLFFQRVPKSVRLGCFLLHLEHMDPTVKNLTGLGGFFPESADNFPVTGEILREIFTEAEASNICALRILTDLWMAGEDPAAPFSLSADCAESIIIDGSPASDGFTAHGGSPVSDRDTALDKSPTSDGFTVCGEPPASDGATVCSEPPISDGATACGEPPAVPEAVLSYHMTCRLIDILCDMAATVSGVYRNLQNRQTDVRFDQVHTVVLALGSLPFDNSVSSLLKIRREEFLHRNFPALNSGKDVLKQCRNYVDIQAFLRFWGPHDPEDRIAWAVAGLLFDGDLEYFRELWNAEFADGTFAEPEAPASLREKRHYERIREAVGLLLSS